MKASNGEKGKDFPVRLLTVNDLPANSKLPMMAIMINLYFNTI